jgi:chromosome segregation ATPase
MTDEKDLDRDSERILVHLSKHDNQAPAQMLKETELSESKQVNYRLTGKLSELVESRPGEYRGQECRRWSLSEQGREFVDENHLEPPRGLSGAIETIRELDGRLRSVESQITNLQLGDDETVAGRLVEVESQLEAIEHDVEETDEELSQDIRAVRESVAELSETVEKCARRETVEAVEERLDDKAERQELGEVRSRQSDLSRAVDDLDAEIDEMDGQLADHQEMYDVFESVELSKISNKLDDIESLEDIEERVEQLPDPDDAREAVQKVDDLEGRIDGLEERVEQIDERAGEDQISDHEDVESHLTKSEKIQKLESDIEDLEESKGGILSKILG